MPSLALPRTVRPLAAVVAVLALAVGTLGVGTAGVVVDLADPAPAAAALPIEDFPDYEPQRTCSPTAKKGTLRLAAWLQRTYPGSGSSGISRSCRSGGQSEHKEGRAFDWRLDARRARDRRYAMGFLTRVRAGDAAGNVGALGRRMGIMYLIWDDRIYSASRGYAPRPYLHSACRTVRRCSRTLRHRDHVHISLSWRGARAQTSWYTGVAPTVPTPPPTPTPTPTPTPAPTPTPTPGPGNGDGGHAPGDGTWVPGTGGGTGGAYPLLDLSRTDAMITPVRAGETRKTRYALQKGRRYKIAVYGVTRYGPAPSQVADAVCSWVPGRGWRAGLDAATRAAYGALDLRVGGTKPFGTTCRTGKHLYQAYYRPRWTGPLKLSLDQPRAAGGSLVVAVTRAGYAVDRHVPSVPAPVAPPTGPREEPAAGAGLLRTAAVVDGEDAEAWTSQRLDAGVTYRVTVTGLLRVADDTWTDGQCTTVTGTDGRWWPQASLDRYDPGADHGNLYLDGVPFDGTAPPEDPDGCSAHAHATTLTPTTSRRLHLQAFDPTPGARDNRGGLLVVVERVTPLPATAVGPWEQPAGSWPWTRKDEKLKVSASSPVTLTGSRFRRGTRVRLEVSGYVRDGGGLRSDATCVRVGDDWVRDPASPTGQDVLELHVDGRAPDWRRTDGEQTCSSSHTYVATVTTTKDGPLALAFLDADRADDQGSLTVRVRRA